MQKSWYAKRSGKSDRITISTVWWSWSHRFLSTLFGKMSDTDGLFVPHLQKEKNRRQGWYSCPADDVSDNNLFLWICFHPAILQSYQAPLFLMVSGRIADHQCELQLIHLLLFRFSKSMIEQAWDPECFLWVCKMYPHILDLKNRLSLPNLPRY